MGVTASVFGKKINRSINRVFQLKREGKLVIDPVDGKIDLEASLSNLKGMRPRRSDSDFLVQPDEEVKPAEASIDMLTHADAVTKKENYLASLRELEYELEAKQVVVMDSVISELTRQFTAMRAALGAVPSKIAPRVIMMNSATEAQDFIEQEIREIQSILSTASFDQV